MPATFLDEAFDATYVALGLPLLLADELTSRLHLDPVLTKARSRARTALTASQKRRDERIAELRSAAESAARRAAALVRPMVSKVSELVDETAAVSAPNGSRPEAAAKPGRPAKVAPVKKSA